MSSSAVHNATVDIIAIFYWMKIFTLLSFHTKIKLFIAADFLAGIFRTHFEINLIFIDNKLSKILCLHSSKSIRALDQYAHICDDIALN